MGKSRNLADAEERFVNTAGDTMTGALQIDGAPANLNLRDTRAATNGLVQVGTRGVNGEIAIIDVDPNNAVSNSNLRFNMDGVERVRIDSAGNVGIGTSSPSQKLDVNGAIKASMVVTESSMGFRNRIINGDMRIAQRGTAAVTANGAFPVDRFSVGEDTTGAYSGQQDSSAPVGFVNSLKFTTTTADTSIAAGELCFLRQFIEGTNVSDLAWGTANAQSVTLSFWVRSSLTGSFSGAIANDGYNRSYPFTYTISVADTWEYKTVTIPGDTTGTWLTTTGIGLRIYWNLGTGTDNTGTANAWVGAGNVGADSTVAVIGTLNATFFITGCQLEAGAVATPFERRPFGAELQLCQRYFEKSYNISIVPGASGLSGGFYGFTTSASATSEAQSGVAFKVSKRAAPTVVAFHIITGAAGAVYRVSDAASVNVTISNIGEQGAGNAVLASGSANSYYFHWTASIEL